MKISGPVNENFSKVVINLKVVVNTRSAYFCSKTGSDTLRSVLERSKNQESRKKYFITVQKVSSS